MIVAAVEAPGEAPSRPAMDPSAAAIRYYRILRTPAA
jgi:hypothetical protein